MIFGYSHIALLATSPPREPITPLSLSLSRSESLGSCSAHSLKKKKKQGKIEKGRKGGGQKEEGGGHEQGQVTYQESVSNRHEKMGAFKSKSLWQPTNNSINRRIVVKTDKGVISNILFYFGKKCLLSWSTYWSILID